MGVSPLAIPRRQIRGFNAGKVDRLGNWGSFSLSADSEIRRSLRVIRAKSRHLAMNNDYFKQFLRLLKINVIGPQGIRLQSKARDRSGAPDRDANRTIEDGWKRFNRKGVYDVTGKLSGRDGQKLWIETNAKDGEYLARMIFNFPNEFGFAIQFLEADHLDENLNKYLANGNKIRMGIEYDEWDRPIAYYLLRNHPGDYEMPSGHSWSNRYQRIPAHEIIHEYTVERARQGRGVPWVHTAAQRLQMLGGFEDAALVNARAGASKMGFYTRKAGEIGGPDEYEGDDTDENGEFIEEAEPGVFGKLPAGWDFKEYNPTFPSTDIAPFSKLMLRGGCSGLGVSYHSVSNDLTDVNFSSIRTGVLDSRDYYRDLQGFTAESFLDRVFANWLLMALLKKALGNLSVADFDRLHAPTWRARGWDWVNPLQDQSAAEKALKNRTKTLAKVLADQGEDLEEHFEQLKEETDLAATYGIDLDKIKDGGKDNAEKLTDPADDDDAGSSKPAAKDGQD